MTHKDNALLKRLNKARKRCPDCLGRCDCNCTEAALLRPWGGEMECPRWRVVEPCLLHRGLR